MLAEWPTEMKPVLPVIAYIDIAVKHLKYDRVSLGPHGVNAGAGNTHIWRKLMLGIFLCCTVLRLSATTIVVIRTDTGFVVAADSGLSDNSGEPLPQPACKVFTAGDAVAWGYGGLMGGLGFDPTSELRRLINNSDLGVLGERVQEAISPELAEQAARLKVTAPARFEFLLKGNDIFQVFMASGQRALLQGYRVKMSANQTVTATMSGTIDCVAGRPTCRTGKIMRIGEDAEIVRFLTAHPVAVQQFSSYVDFAKFLVGLEIDASPKTVRLPIDVVEVTSKAIVWRQRKPECNSMHESDPHQP